MDVELGDALQLAEQLGSYAYDAYVISCALKHHCPLVSLDHQMIRYAKHVGANVLEVQA